MEDVSLLFSNFEVSFFYGFTLESDETKAESLVARLRDPETERPPEWVFPNEDDAPAWALLYRLEGHGRRMLRINLDPPVSLQVTRLECPVLMKQSVFVRDDGAGAARLTFKTDSDPTAHTLTLDDLGKLMNLVPRTIPPPGRGLSRVEPEPGEPIRLTKAEQALFDCSSDCFKLFMLAVKKLAQAAGSRWHWREVGTLGPGDHGPLHSGVLYSGKDRDPQIPYMYMHGWLEDSLFKKAFREEGSFEESKRQLRNNFAREIAAILRRFSATKNSKRISEDYLRRHHAIATPGPPSLVENRHPNSELFIALSDFATFSMAGSEDAGKEMPYRYSRNAILRSLELSKLRWHYAVYLNRLLDRFAEELGDPTFSKEMKKRLYELFRLRQKVARNLEDFSVYTFDDHMGAEVARSMRSFHIDELEESTRRKLTIIDRLFEDQIELARLREFLRIKEGA